MVKIYGEFQLKDGRKLVLRSPRWEDLDDFLEFINSLVEEEADIIINKRVTREEEADWLARYLADIEKGKTIGVVAEVDGKVIGNSEVTKGTGTESHVGFLGVAITKEHRNLGVGTRVLETLVEESKKAGLKLLVLDVYASNTRARHVYRKLGFRDAGTIPRMAYRRKEYFDVVRMYLEF